MTRPQLEHILRAAAGITGANEFVLVGSQAILGLHEKPPAELTHSMEADLYSPRSQEDSDLIEGSIGDGSPFQTTFGYCAHGVGPDTAIFPKGWQSRAVKFRTPATGGATALVPEVHDLAISKLLAGRDKDFEYVRALIGHGLARPTELLARLQDTPIPKDQRELAVARLDRLQKPA